MQAQQLVRVFSENVRRIRLDLGLTQTELAVKMGVQQGHVSAVENGRLRPTLTTVALFSEALKVEPSRLFVRTRAKSDGSINRNPNRGVDR